MPTPSVGGDETKSISPVDAFSQLHTRLKVGNSPLWHGYLITRIAFRMVLAESSTSCRVSCEKRLLNRAINSDLVMARNRNTPLVSKLVPGEGRINKLMLAMLVEKTVVSLIITKDLYQLAGLSSCPIPASISLRYRIPDA